jgi:hypothetical protein
MERILPENYKKVKKSIPVSIGNIHKVKIIDRSEKGDGIAKIKNFILNRYTPQLCCGWDRSSNIFKREYTFYIGGRIKTCKPLCV